MAVNGAAWAAGAWGSAGAAASWIEAACGIGASRDPRVAGGQGPHLKRSPVFRRLDVALARAAQWSDRVPSGPGEGEMVLWCASLERSKAGRV
ncbi:hypothetical protein NDU88_002615 [Pleurodeles waltl]|uniref:Uncharacterized protein n=1 Tax=Pleurodeles waltl TaxID=8319 RepID=A0AAV7T2V5_PLEWA|nr:hypothetical protein NDU88_002615 [Pleurodeles waltl]